MTDWAERFRNSQAVGPPGGFSWIGPGPKTLAELGENTITFGKKFAAGTTFKTVWDTDASYVEFALKHKNPGTGAFLKFVQYIKGKVLEQEITAMQHRIAKQGMTPELQSGLSNAIKEMLELGVRPEFPEMNAASADKEPENSDLNPKSSPGPSSAASASSGDWERFAEKPKDLQADMEELLQQVQTLEANQKSITASLHTVSSIMAERLTRLEDLLAQVLQKFPETTL